MISRVHETTESNRTIINSSIIADIVGDDAIPPVDLGAPEYERQFLYAALSLYSSTHRFDDYEILLRTYPWKGKLSRARHFSHAVYSILNESYLFEARLKRYFDAIKICAKELRIEVSPTLASLVLKSYHKSFQGLLKARGSHIHVLDFEPRELKRISLIELFQFGDNPLKSSTRAFLPGAVRDFRRT